MLPEFEDQLSLDLSVLVALVEGYRARAGTKERFQVLSEYELARRVGIHSYSFVEYESSPERESIESALSRLQGRGLVRVASMSGRYQTYVPTDEGQRQADKQRPAAPAETAEPAPPGPVHTTAADTARIPVAPAYTLEGRLDEMIRLLRSIDERLARIERG